MENIINAPAKVPDGVYFDGKFLPMSYEELVDLFATFREHGNDEHCVLKRSEAASVFGDLLPRTAY